MAGYARARRIGYAANYIYIYIYTYYIYSDVIPGAANRVRGGVRPVRANTAYSANGWMALFV